MGLAETSLLLFLSLAFASLAGGLILQFAIWYFNHYRVNATTIPVPRPSYGKAVVISAHLWLLESTLAFLHSVALTRWGKELTTTGVLDWPGLVATLTFVICWLSVTLVLCLLLPTSVLQGLRLTVTIMGIYLLIVGVPICLFYLPLFCISSIRAP